MKETATTNDTPDTGGVCPVKHDNVNLPHNGSPSFSLFNWPTMFSSSSSKTTIAIVSDTAGSSSEPSMNNNNFSAPTAQSTCPVTKGKSENIPASLEEAERYAQTPQPDQTISLALERQVSSIPRGGGGGGGGSGITDDDVKVPDHQLMKSNDDGDKKWVYPSEQQMYNAMRKKGWTNVPEESIPVVLKIHNHINESTWNQILDWENANSSSSSSSVKLVRFQGRPDDMSPKAYLLSTVLRLYDPPFDRHDWYVQNNNGNGNSSSHSNNNNDASSKSNNNNRIQRYVIDYYYLPTPKNQNPNMPPIPYIDARPALDHPYAIYLHGRRFLQLAFPGITAYLKKNDR